MQRIWYFIITLFALLLVSQLAFGQQVIPVEPFNEITITGDMEVDIVPGETEEVVLTVRGIPEDKVNIKVSQGVLRISALGAFKYSDESVYVKITYRNLFALRANAGAQVSVAETLSAEKILLRATTGGQLNAQVATQVLDLGASEGGNLKVWGTTESMEVTTSTGGQFSGDQLEAERAYVRSSTGGTAEVYATKLLEVSANTGGSVFYRGEPETKRIKKFVAGEVDRINR